MSEEKKRPAPVIIDADAFDPIARNVFRYRGEDYPAFDVLQISNAARERVKRLNEHLNACTTLEAQADVLTAIVRDFVPTAPIDALRNEPLEKLMDLAVRFTTAIGGDGDARPTKARPRSASRRNTGR